ncbi:MAG TPA: hypothetical protein VFA52_03925 [Candidatus Paceibacterota bacterium]|nr:hypothetical protein [Candidatus Paceibacterota bacterium]
MKSFFILLLSLILIGITIGIDHLSKHFYLYWQTGWIDASVHFLGGLSATLFFSWVYFYTNLFKNPLPRKKSTLVLFVLYILIVGILWEIYEYHFGFSFFSQYFVSDTISDLSMDVLGGLLAYFLTTFLI